MHDLRKQALGLESGKTMSRKARSKLGTPSTSRGNSTAPSPRNDSRTASRNASDDEDEFSDGTAWSNTSIDEMIAPADEEEEAGPPVWIGQLEDKMNEICDRKRSSAQGREETLTYFTALLTRHYTMEVIRPRIAELIPAILKSVKSGKTEKETVLALKALALILVTDPSDTVYDVISGPTKNTITDAQHVDAKLAAIHSLSVATFYGGASEDEVEAVMEFFLDVISSDGAVVEEADNAQIVEAALMEWGFLATQLEDMQESTEAAMETFVDQLDSSDVDVQVAAGQNIALLFEKSYTEVEPEDHLSDDEDPDDEELESISGPRMVKRYTAYRQQHQLEQVLANLTNLSNKRLSKDDRKFLHRSFADVLTTVEKPIRGPYYSTAINDETGKMYGSRMRIAIGGGNAMTIDKWWKLHRFNGLKRLLQSGFLVHYEFNEVIFESLPVVTEVCRPRRRSPGR